jgi:hypothetical protein
MSSPYHFDFAGGLSVACPFFMPLEKLQNGSWLHASRLPLGCGWTGHCTAPGHEGQTPSPEELREFCNLGYAQDCTRLPRDRSWDSVRLAARSLVGGQIQLRYVCERDHRPAEHGFLHFDTARSQWAKPHPDRRVQRMAECVLESYLAKSQKQDANHAAAS